jgi:hypothetical protein
MALVLKDTNLKKEFLLFQRALYFEMAGDKLVFKDNAHAYNAMVGKIQGLVLAQCGALGVTTADIIRVLHKYVGAGDMRQTIQTGAVQKQFEVDSWASLANLVVYELKSEVNYLTEIDLAEMVAMSARVKASVEAAGKVLSACLDMLWILHVRIKDVDLTAVETAGHRDIAAKARVFRAAWGPVNESYTSEDFELGHKHYRAFVSEMGAHPLMDLAPGASEEAVSAGFEKRTAVLHDLLQVLYDFFADDAVMRIYPHPLEKSVNTLTGTKPGRVYGTNPVMEPRSKDVDKRSKAFAKSRGRPSEAGPSYTTVRVCSLNAAAGKVLEIAAHFDAFLEKAKATMVAREYEKSKEAIVKARSGIRQLTEVERKDTVWAMFGYWTLYYRKSVGPAHTFFEIREAASQCGVVLTKHDRYPTLDKMVTKMGLEAYVPTLATRLRKRALKLGLELSVVKDASTMNERTLGGFAPGRPILVRDLVEGCRARDERWDVLRAQQSMAGVSVRRALPNPFVP